MLVITEEVTSFLLDLMSWLVGLLPMDTVTWPVVTGLSGFLGVNLGPLDSIAPLSEAFEATELAVDTIIPTLFAIRVILWLWFMLPFVK